MKKEKISAVVLAAGQGKRMNSRIQKQYLILNDRPLIYYALRAFEDSAVDEIVLVTGDGEVDYCKREIVDKYDFRKVVNIVTGGKERYNSVYAGLEVLKDCDYVIIHDGARPFVTEDIINASISAVKEFNACATGVPVKDTIKVCSSDGLVSSTPDRSSLWSIQTPQTFSYNLIYDAYRLLLADEKEQYGITDDAMVIEKMTKTPVKIVHGSYNNIKVTTPEDMMTARIIMEEKAGEKKIKKL